MNCKGYIKQAKSSKNKTTPYVMHFLFKTSTTDNFGISEVLTKKYKL